MKHHHSKEKIQVVSELHRPVRKNFLRRRTIIKGIDDLWQGDLIELGIYASENDNHKFILVIIDCFSKFIWVKALKSKGAEEVSRVFAEILKESARSPKNLQTDQGKEFFNSKFKNLMKKYNINHYNTYNVKKAAIVERVIRTIKEKIFKSFSLNGTYRWLDILPTIIHEYNNVKHRTINMKPNEVNESNEQLLLKNRYNHIKIAAHGKFKVGDMVRISKFKHIFSKGYLPNWTTEIFKINKIQITNPVTYLLDDLQGQPIRGAFYEPELQKAKYSDVYLVEKILRKKGNKLLVRWLGFDKSHDSWINKSNKL